MPKFSIITVSLNQQKYIKKTINSVLKQTFTDYELIICDGASTDKTVEIIKKFEKKFKQRNLSYKWSSKKDGGIYQGMNNGIASATGDYTIFMNSGDFFYNKNVLQHVANELNSNKDIDILYGRNCAFPYGNKYDYDTKYLFLRSGICHQATFIKTSLLKEHPYQYKYEIVNDFDSFLHFKINNKKFLKSNIIIAWSLPGGLSGKNYNHTFLQELSAIQSYENERIKKFNNSFLQISTDNERSILENLITGWWYKDKKQLIACGEKSTFLFTLTDNTSDYIISIIGEQRNYNQSLYVNNKYVCEMHFANGCFTSVLPSFLINSGLNIFEIRSPIKGNELVNLLVQKIVIEKRSKLAIASKNILFIGHPYHNKTKSSEFIKDLYRKHYNVTEIYIGENGNFDILLKYFGYCFDLLVVWQNNLNMKLLAKYVKFKKSVFFPMFDGSRTLDLYGPIGASLINSKIICFSHKMHEKFISHGYDSHYIQFFPEPCKSLTLNNPKSIYLWQRIDCIDLKTIYKTIYKSDMDSIVLHHSIDPGYKDKNLNDYGFLVRHYFRKCKIADSYWFKNKNDLIKEIDSCAIYFAPREYEGIGMSFLSAMAMGKCVIAPDNSTMNEYIKNGVNGFLYSPKLLRNRSCSRIKLDNINVIQENTYKYIKNGYSKWQKEKENIIKWSEEEIKPNINLYFKSCYKKD